MEPAVASHRELGCHDYSQLLGVHAPACLCTRLSTSNRFPVLLRAYIAWLDGLTDRVGSTNQFHQPLWPGFVYRTVAESSKEEDFLAGYEAAPAMPRPDSIFHARFTSSSFKMRPFDIRHPSRDAEQEILCSTTIYAANRKSVRSRFCPSLPPALLVILHRGVELPFQAVDLSHHGGISDLDYPAGFRRSVDGTASLTQ